METAENEHNIRQATSTSAGEGEVEEWFARILRQVPPRVLARGIIILAGLCLVKVGIVFSLRSELFQAHWRTSREMPSWIDYPAFYGLGLLIGLNLWVFGQKCASLGIGAVRAAFGTLVLGSGLFILLTFHEAQFGYVNAVLNGSIDWRDLGPYLQLNFFFRPPFLALWIGGLGAIYYLLVRTGREQHILKFLAVFASAYFLVNFSNFLEFQYQLLVLDVIGIACLAIGARASRGLRWFVSFGPWALMASAFLLFGGLDSGVAMPAPELVVMVLACGLLFGTATLVARRRGYYNAWSFLMPFLSVSFLVLAMDNFPRASNYRSLLLWGVSLPRYFVWEFVLTTVLVLLAVVYCRWRPKGNLVWMDFLGLAAIALAFADLRLAQIMGVRIDWQVLSSSDLNSPQMIWRMMQPYLPMLLLSFALGIGGYMVLYRLSRRISTRRPLGGGSSSVGWQYAISAGVLLGIVGLGLLKPDKAEGQVIAALVKTGPWWKRLVQPVYSKEVFLQKVREFGMENMAQAVSVAEPKASRDLNVVLIFQESVYNKHLSLFGGTNATQPLLAQYTNRMELFPNFYSCFAKSIHARFATFTGLYPVQEYADFTRNHVPVKSIFEVLGDRGYECSMFYSSFYDYTNFRDLLRGRGLTHMYDADTMPGERKSERVVWGLKEHETLSAIQGQIRQYGANGKRFFLTYVPAAPHYPFDGVPERFRKRQIENMGDYTPRFLNELEYMDWVISEILVQLKESGLLDNTLVVITSDHGEMLGDDRGLIGHGWELSPELTNVPLMILDPANRQFRINSTPGSQVDLLPTMLDLLGVPQPEGQLYQGVSLYRTGSTPERVAYLNSHRKFGLLKAHTLMFGDREMDDYTRMGTYTVTNLGSEPQYLPVSDTGPHVDMEAFDRFQENFLRHYAEYARMLQVPLVVE